MSMMDYRYCPGCPLEGVSEPMDVCGSKGARFLVVTDAPREEAHLRAGPVALPPNALSVFKQAMAKEDFGRDEFAFVPQVRCPHNPDKFSNKEKTLAQKHCRQYLLHDIRRMKPDIVLPLGKEAAKQATGRAVKITKVRGVVEDSEELDTFIMPMLSPTQVVLYPQHHASFAADCATLGRLVDSGYDITASGRVPTGDYEFIEDLEFLIKAKPELIGFDTEGSGLTMPGSDSLRWYAPDAKLLSLQFCIEPGKAYMLPWNHPDVKLTSRRKAALKEQFRRLMCRPDITIVGHNLKFDTLMVLRHLDCRIRIGSDTLMMVAMVDENALTKNLDDSIKRYVPEMAGYADYFNSTVDKGNLDKHPLDREFLDYGCGDADAVLRLDKVLYEIVSKDKKLLNYYDRVALPALNSFVSMETRGMHVDPNEIAAFEEAMRAQVQEQYDSLIKQVPRSIRRAHVDKGLSFSRTDFIRDILFYHPDGFRLKPKVFTKTTSKLDEERRVPSTSSKDHLPFFYEECPFTADLAQHIKDSRLLNTNVIGFQNKYLVDNMVRPQYRLDVAVTGRTSSDDPNGQNMPVRGEAAKAYRRLFLAPPGHYVIGADLSQAELRIAASMANDPTMLRIFQSGGDIHTETALIVMGIGMAEFERLLDDERKLARFKAKAVNFGFIYGMWWKKFIIYAKTQYGVTFSPKEAERIRNAFFEKYYNLGLWHEEVRRYVRQHKQVRSYSGRVRHLPMIDSVEDWVKQEAERQGINSPVQEFASTLGVMAVSRMEHEIDPAYLSVVSFVHDAIYAYVPCEYLEWGAKVIKHYMESNPLKEWFNLELKAPIVADVSFGNSLGEMYELKGLKVDPPTLRGRASSRYDFSQFWEEDKQKGIIVPAQRTPPNGGRRQESLYTGFSLNA